MREHAFHASCNRIGVDVRGPYLGEERRKCVEQHLGCVLARAREHPLAEHAGRNVGAPQLHVDRLLDVIGTAFFDHEHGAFSRTELAQLLRHQREADVEHVERNAARPVEIGEIEPRQRA